MGWIALGFGSAVFASLVAVFGKAGMSHIDSTLATTLRSIIMAVFLVGLAAVLGKFENLSSVDSRAWLYIALAGVAGALSWLCYFWALKIGPVAGVVALDRTSIIFALILSALFLSEGISWKTGLGSVFVLIGAILFTIK